MLGYFKQESYRTHVLDFDCDKNQKVSHFVNTETPEHGSNNILLYDLNGDGQRDLLMGNQFYSNVQAFYNDKLSISVQRDSMVAQDTIWKDKSGKPALIEAFPALFKIDVYMDGIKDLIISPNGSELGENVDVMHYYKAAINPQIHKKELTHITNRLITEDVLDFGYQSNPFFYDYNKDGKPDLLVTSYGKYKGLGQQGYHLSYLQNESNLQVAFQIKDSDIQNLGNNIKEPFMFAIGDVNGDQLDDFVYVLQNGTIKVLTNVASSNAVSPVWQNGGIQVKDSASGLQIKAKGLYTVSIKDLDGDGVKDFVLGDTSARLRYYRTTRQKNNIWEVHLETETVGGIDILGEFSARYYWGPLDGSSKEYLVLGHVRGGVSIFETSKDWRQAFQLIEQNILFYATKEYASPAIADVDNDGAFEMIVDNFLGGIQLFSQNKHVGITDFSLKNVQKNFELYPNPAVDKLFVRGGMNA